MVGAAQPETRLRNTPALGAASMTCVGRKVTKAADFSAAYLDPLGLYLDVLESGNGRHDWIRTSDLFRVKEAL